MSGYQYVGWIVAALLSCASTEVVRRYALRRSILDVPGPRSSHTVPVPRGGGLAIMFAALTPIAVGGFTGTVPTNVAIGIVGGGGAIAWIGWVDDRRPLPARPRLLVHLLGSIWFLGWIGGLDTFQIGHFELRLGLFGSVIAAITAVWFINLYNFMDGIDGMAAGGAVVLGSLGGLMFLLAGDPGFANVSMYIAAASAGFLVWNWTPARIFMGDAGSGLLGFLFVALAFASEAAGAVPFAAWVMMMGAFFVDTTATLVRRVIRGENWREGHRLHAFQRAMLRVGSHPPVTVAVMAITAVLCALGWGLTIRPDLSLMLIGSGILLVTAAYLAVEHVAPMYPQRRGRRVARVGSFERGPVDVRARDELAMHRPVSVIAGESGEGSR